MIRSPIVLCFKIFIAIIVSLLLIGMLGLSRLSEKVVHIKPDSFIIRYIPQDIRFEHLLLRVEKFYQFPTLEMQNFSFKNDIVEIKAPAVFITWRLQDVLLGNLRPMAVRAERLQITLKLIKETDTNLTMQDILKKFLQDLPLKYLEFQQGDLDISMQDENSIKLHSFTLYVFKNIAKTLVTLQGNLSLENNTIPLELRLSLNALTSSLSGSLKTDQLKLEMLPLEENEVFSSIKKFYPYLIKGTFSFDISPAFRDIDFDGRWDFVVDSKTSIPLFAKGNWNQDKRILDLKVGSASLKANMLGKIWYPSAPKVRDWVLKSIPVGHIKNIKVDMRVHLPEGGEAIAKKVDGFFSLVDGTLLYKEGLPALTGLNCKAVFDLKNVQVEVYEAFVRDLKIYSSSAIITGFEKEFLDLELDLKMENSLESLVWFLNHPPLKGVLNELVQKASGIVDGEVTLKIPLKDNLSFAQVQLNGFLKFSEAVIELNMRDHTVNLNDVFLNLNLYENGMHLSGKVNLDGFHAIIDINKQHKEKADIKRYTVNGAGNIKPILALLPPILSPYFISKGGGNMLLKYSSYEDTNAIMHTDIQADFKNANLSMPFLNWSKKQREKGNLKLSYKTQDGALKSIEKFSLASKNLNIQGNARFNTSGHMEFFSLDPLAFNKSKGILKGILKNGGWQIDARFPYLHGVPIMHSLKEYMAMDDNGKSTYTVKTTIKDLILSDGIHIGDFSLEANVQEGEVQLARLFAGREREMLKVLYEPQQDHMQLSIYMQDSDPFFKGLKLGERFRGKGIKIEASKVRHQLDIPLKGTFSAEQIKIKDAPILAKLLSLISIEGLIDQLRGEGLVFKDNEVVFQYKDQVIAIERAKMMNASIGITAQGYIRFKEKEMDLEGVLVPANFFNQILGNVPIIGNILSGGENQGLFSISYSIKGVFDKPKVRSNPLGLLAPNFLKGLFQGITKTKSSIPSLEAVASDTQIQQ